MRAKAKSFGNPACFFLLCWQLLEVGTSRDTRCERGEVDKGRIRESTVL